jgi:holo-[acyl-carrier protein] synthase
MAIYGVGIDLIRVDRLRASLERWGERFEKRVFTEIESRACENRKNRASCLAMRFAAKEAFVKALGTGMRSPVSWRDIEVQNTSSGQPVFALSNHLLMLCGELGIHSWHLSLTDDGEYGAALVVLERNESVSR